MTACGSFEPTRMLQTFFDNGRLDYAMRKQASYQLPRVAPRLRGQESAGSERAFTACSISWGRPVDRNRNAHLRLFTRVLTLNTRLGRSFDDLRTLGLHEGTANEW